LIELCWSLLKRGILRLKDDADDNETSIIQLAVNPGQRARARVIGGKLCAVRQHLRRTARRATYGKDACWEAALGGRLMRLDALRTQAHFNERVWGYPRSAGGRVGHQKGSFRFPRPSSSS